MSAAVKPARKATIRLGGERFAFDKLNPSELEQLRSIIWERREHENAAYLRSAIRSTEGMPSGVRETIIDQALSRAAKFSVVTIDDAIVFATSTTEGAAHAIALQLARNNPESKWTYEAIVNEFLSMSPAEQSKMISLDDGNGDGDAADVSASPITPPAPQSKIRAPADDFAD